MGSALSSALETPALRRLQIAWGVSSSGAWVFFIVLAIYAYQAGGAAAVGAAALARMVPAGLVAPLAGLLADRRPRRDVLLVTLVARALVLGGMAAATAGGAPLGVVLALGALFTMATTAHKPAQASLLPTLAETPQQLSACNAVWGSVDNASFLVGALAGGVLVSVAGIPTAFAVTAALFAISAVPVARIPRDTVPSYRAADGDAGGPWTGVLAGFRDIRADRGLRTVVGIQAASTLVEGAADVLVVVIALELLDLGDAGVGWLNACWGVGGLAGGAAALAMLGRRPATAFLTGGVLIGLSLMAVPLSGAPLPVAIAIGVLGIGYALIETAGLTLLHRLSSDEVLGRSFAAVESTYWITTGVGAILAPAVIALLGIDGALLAIGAALPLLVAVRGRALRHLDTGAAVGEREFQAVRSVPGFAPLPIATAEDVARRLHEHRIPAGAVVIREGEPGDCCYIVAEGSLDVSCGAARLETLGAGDYFGEVALLRDVARTATVTARSPAVLFALDRDDFLFTVSAHPRTTEAVSATTNARMEDARVH